MQKGKFQSRKKSIYRSARQIRKKQKVQKKKIQKTKNSKKKIKKKVHKKNQKFKKNFRPEKRLRTTRTTKYGLLIF